MNTLSSWTPSLLMFAAAFVLVSLVSGLIYWVAHLSSPKMRWVKIGGSILASLVLCVSASGGIAPSYLLSFIVGVLALSALQTLVERGITGHYLATKEHLVRAFFSYICSICVVGVSFSYIISFIVRAAPVSLVWGLDLAAGLYGLLAGLVVAPLSLSFFRWMFQTLALRPGIDRPLHQDEMVR